jgi:hypothetical protein
MAIDKLDWFSAREEGLGNLYEGLLEKNAAEKKSGAGQYFTPRPLIDCIVRLTKPQPGEVIQDPAAGTAGFIVAFSCKGRGLCPSCNARRMAETAAHLVDHVIPPLPVRQWVLSVPKRLRWYLEREPRAISAVLCILLRVIEAHLRQGRRIVW